MSTDIDPTPVLSDRDGGLAIITLNRPDRLNALSEPVMDALLDALRQTAEDHTVRAVLLRAAGRGFCAGGDMKAGGISREKAATMTTEDRAAHLRRHMDSARLLHTMAKPTVTAFRGAVMGAGVGLALSADFRIASTTLKLETAFRNLAFSGDFGGAYFLTQLAGPSAARDLMMLSGQRIGAERALQLGLVSRVVDDEQLDDEALKLAQDLANGPSVALQHMKRAINAAATGASVAEVLDLEAAAMVRTSFTEDHKEAVRAFMDKRAPAFNGR